MGGKLALRGEGIKERREDLRGFDLKLRDRE
jgi:hypothetical protein